VNRALGRLEQAHEAARQRRLSAARLADQSKGLPLAKSKGHVVDCVDLRHLAIDQHAFLDREVQLQVVDLQERRVLAVGAHAAAPSFGPSPISPSTIRRFRFSSTESQQRSL
jgi:hypothetical protein